MSLTSAIKGITIQFGADMTPLNKALKQINSESRSIQTELNKVDKALKLDPKNTELVTQKQTLLKDAIATTTTKLDSLKQAQESVNKAHAANADWEKQYTPLKKQIDETAEKMKKLASQEEEMKQKLDSGEISTEEYEKYRKELDEVTQEHKNLMQSKRDLEKQFEDGHISDEEYREYQREVATTEQKLKSLQNELATTGSKAIILGQQWQESGEKIKSTGEKISKAGNALTLGVTAPIAAIGTLSFKSAMEFESAFAGVTKTVDGTTQQINSLRQGIIDMSLEIPASTTEISAVAEAAGQLGIATEDVLDFTRVMVDMGESTNLAAEEAASSLAKFANVTKMDPEDYSRLGSVIVDLGNNFATTEADIVAMSTKMASAASMAGFTEQEILALSASLSSVGNEAEAGGSTASKLITMIQLAVETGSDSLESYANVANMTAEEFSNTWSGSPMDAMYAFLAGLSDTERLGKSTAAVLSDMDITELRLSNATRSLASDSEGLKSAVETANAAWDENNALTEEASKRYETTESKIDIAKNTLTESGRQIGENLLPVVADLAQGAADLTKGFSELSPETQKNIIAIAGLAAAAGPVLKVTGGVTKGIGSLTEGLGKLSKNLGQKAAAKAAETALEGVGDAASTATASTGGLSGVLGKIASPAGVAVVATAAVTALGVALYTMNQKAIQSKIDEKFGSIKLSAEEVEDVAKRLTTTDWTVKVDAYVDAKSKLDEFESSMQESIEVINKLDWKVSVGLGLTEEEQQNYKDSVSSYISSVNDYIEQQHYTTALALEVTLDPDSASYASLSSFTDNYYTSTQAELAELGQQLADKVNESFENGTFSEDNPDIQAIRQKINEKVQELADQEFEASLDNFSMELRSEGLSLDYDSFKGVNDKISEEIQGYIDGSEEARITALMDIEAQYQANIDAGMSKETAKKISDTAKEEMETELSENKTEIILKGFSFVLGEIDDKYKDEIDTAYQEVSDFMLDANFQSIDDFSVALNTAMTGMASSMSGDGKKAIQEAFDALAPQKEQLETLAQQYIDAGQEVPESLRQGLSDISQMGAIIGDIDSLYLSMGEQIANSPEKLKALEEMAASGEEIPQELADAIQIYSGKVYDASTGTFKEITAASDDMQQTIIDELNRLGWDANNELANALADGYDVVYDAETGKWQAAIDATNTKGQEAVDTATTKGGDVSKGTAAGLEEYNPLVKDSAAKNKEIIEGELDFGTTPYTWGWHINENISGGMTDGQYMVENAVSAIAGVISGTLKHSTPEKGPLKDDDVWMVHMMDNLANGIKSGRQKVEDEVGKVAEGIQSVMNEPIEPEVDFSTYNQLRDIERNVAIRVQSSIANENDIVSALAEKMQNAPIVIQVSEGDVNLDGEKVGRTITPTVSRLQAKNSKYG